MANGLRGTVAFNATQPSASASGPLPVPTSSHQFRSAKRHEARIRQETTIAFLQQQLAQWQRWYVNFLYPEMRTDCQFSERAAIVLQSLLTHIHDCALLQRDVHYATRAALAVGGPLAMHKLALHKQAGLAKHSGMSLVLDEGADRGLFGRVWSAFGQGEDCADTKLFREMEVLDLLSDMAAAAPPISGARLFSSCDQSEEIWTGVSLHARLSGRSRFSAVNDIQPGDLVTTDRKPGILRVKRVGDQHYLGQARVVRSSENFESWSSGEWVTIYRLTKVIVGTRVRAIEALDSQIPSGVDGNIIALDKDSVEIEFLQRHFSATAQHWDKLLAHRHIPRLAPGYALENVLRTCKWRDSLDQAVQLCRNHLGDMLPYVDGHLSVISGLVITEPSLEIALATVLSEG